MEFKKYPKIKLIGDDENKEMFVDMDDELYIEEKIDGGCGRIFIREGSYIFGSRTRELDEDNPNTKNFHRSIVFLKDKLDKANLEGYHNLILFGEFCLKHTMSYDWDKIPPFLGFDIYDVDNDKFLDYDNKVICFKDLDIPIVPLIWKGKVSDMPKITEEFIPKSVYNELEKAEGCVIKNYGKQISSKFVREEFKEKNHKAFGMSKKFAENDDERVVAIYCPNARIDKIIFKLLDEGFKLEMKLMEQLPRRVIEDIYEENWREICHSNWSVNFKGIRKKINDRCRTVLQQIIINNSLR